MNKVSGLASGSRSLQTACMLAADWELKNKKWLQSKLLPPQNEHKTTGRKCELEVSGLVQYT